MKKYIQNPRTWAIIAQAVFIFKDIFILSGLVFNPPPNSPSSLIPVVIWTVGPPLLLHIFMIVGLLACWNWFLYFGLTIGIISLAKNLFLIYSMPAHIALPVALWMITCISIIFEFRKNAGESSAAPIPKKKKLIVLGVGLAILIAISPFIMTMLSFVNMEGRKGGTAPEKSFQQRRQWAKHLSGYNEYFKHVERWVKNSDMIKSDLGEVNDMAPLGSPNYYQGCFTDGCYAAMNLEVIGKNGTGYLFLPYINIQDSTPPTITGIGNDASWRFGSMNNLITPSGQGYLKFYGQKEKYDHVMKLDVNLNSHELIAAYEEMKKNLEPEKYVPFNFNQFPPKPLSELSTEPKIFHWHDFYQIPLRTKFAQAFEHQGNVQQAVELNKWVASKKLEIVSNKLRRSSEQEKINWDAIKEELTKANGLLRQCHKISPDDKSFLYLANRRVGLWYLAIARQESYPPSPSTPKVRAGWGQKTLGIFYTEAHNWINQSAEIENQVGQIKSICAAEHGQNEVSVFDNYYGSFMNLEVLGPKGKLGLNVIVEEQKEKLPPIDLYADNPRMPSSPLQIERIEWKDLQGKEFILIYHREFFKHTNQLKMEIPFVNRKCNGRKKEYFPNGNLHVTVDYKDDKKNGVQTFYYENGNIDVECPVVNGLEEGECRFYNPDGSLKRTVVYRQGKPLN